MHDRTLALPCADPMAPHLLAAASFLGRYSNPHTRAGYASDLRIFFAWALGNGMDPLTVRRVHVQLFVRYLETIRGYRPSGIERTIVAVRGYFETALLDEIVDRNPTKGVVIPRVVNDPTSKVHLTRHEFADLITAARAHSPAAWALVHLLGTVGMRVSEACAIDLRDITTRQGWPVVRVVQKGGKPMWKAIPVPIVEAIDAARAGRDEGALLVRRDGSRMTRRSAGYRLERLGLAAGLTKHLHPHALRRTHITMALQDGLDVRIVQASVGHADPRTTLLYDAIGVEPHNQSSHRIAAIVTSAA